MSAIGVSRWRGRVSRVRVVVVGAVVLVVGRASAELRPAHDLEVGVLEGRGVRPDERQRRLDRAQDRVRVARPDVDPERPVARRAEAEPLELRARARPDRPRRRARYSLASAAVSSAGEPVATIRPASITQIRSACSASSR